MLEIIRAVLAKLACNHVWSKETVNENVVMTCTKCGKMEVFSSRCTHVWKKETSSSLYERGKNSGTSYPIKITNTYVCTKCGEFKQITI